MKRFFSTLAATLCLIAPSAQAGPWFLHPFGELRAYHGDWLAVCRENGAGPCRAVQYRRMRDEGFFGDSQLALSLLDEGWALGVFDDRMTEDGSTNLSIIIDGSETLDMEARPGSPEFGNVSQSLWVPINDDLVDALQRSNRVEVIFPGGSETFSLRGVTAATTAIVAQARGERH